jgi:hypothetical protein
MTEEEEVKRQDCDCYCPRVDQLVLILDDTCFFPDKKKGVCQGCAFDGNFVLVKLILLTTEMLQSPRGLNKNE